MALTFLPGIAAAQNENLDIVAEPICFAVRNEAPYKVYGNFATAEFQRPDGIKTRHRSNFRLEEAGATDPETGEALDQAEFCSYGPFFPERKLELVLRTLFPIFNCMTKIDQGELVISGYRKPEGGAVTTVKCFE
ncbi:MAG: hypothetical protein IT559_03850 [Alphaproteobacteria bacterium]|nr:hypothetical protein [Alphaproteobacteria bacterium]